MAKTKRLSLPVQTMFSELETRSADAEFGDLFAKKGAFKKKKRHNKYYWYHQYRDGTKVIQTYVGKYTDKDVTDRIKEFERLKNDFDARREMVKSLRAAGLPVADPVSGNIIEAIGAAGFFRLRGVLVGTNAYQCYSGILGIVLSSASLRTEDADLAQYFAISQQIDDSMPPVLETLKGADDTFREIPHISDPRQSTTFVNDMGYRVEFLTPNRGKDEYEDRPAPMPALGGASAIPLRFLDFLIRNPIRSVILHDAGVPVTIPTPERYAVHKLIVASRRHATARSKAPKDIEQASSLVEALSERRFLDLSEAWAEAWKRGPSWRQHLMSGVSQMSEESRSTLETAVTKGARRRRIDPETIWPSAQMKLDLEQAP